MKTNQTADLGKPQFRSATYSVMMIVAIILLLLIPSLLVQGLINERQERREETVRKINAKWGQAQTIGGLLLVVPYSHFTTLKEGPLAFCITPERLDMRTTLSPEERHYGIYKTILYRSTTVMTGHFKPLRAEELNLGDTTLLHWDKAYLQLGISDLKGVVDDIVLTVNGRRCRAQPSGSKNEMIVPLDLAVRDTSGLAFECTLSLKGSSSIGYRPVGRTTEVTVSGDWSNPSFTGNYTPDYTLGEQGFEARWKILTFNRNIPDVWATNIGKQNRSDPDLVFGVRLVGSTDIYQQTMRSAKYAGLFLVLTFAVFFFVGMKYRKRIHPIKYMLIGGALILFYCLLLSVSEYLGFGWAYLLSSMATIGLITLYGSAIFKNGRQTVALAALLTGLYGLFYVILSLEEMALLVGSIGLFVVLGVFMYVSTAVDWDDIEK